MIDRYSFVFELEKFAQEWDIIKSFDEWFNNIIGGRYYLGKIYDKYKFEYNPRSVKDIFRIEQILRLYGIPFHITRVDICADTNYPIGYLVSEARSRSNAQKYAIHGRITSQSTEEIETYYIGSRSSRVQIRVYDKFVESADARYFGLNRYELQIRANLKRDKAISSIASFLYTVDISKYVPDCLQEEFELEIANILESERPAVLTAGRSYISEKNLKILK